MSERIRLMTSTQNVDVSRQLACLPAYLRAQSHTQHVKHCIFRERERARQTATVLEVAVTMAATPLANHQVMIGPRDQSIVLVN